MKMGVTILAPQGVENFVSDLEAFWVLFGPQVASRTHLGAKKMREWTPGEAQGPRNHKKIMKSGMDF